MEKQVNLGPSGSDAATLEAVKLSPPPQPEEEVKIFEAEAEEQTKQTYPVAVATGAADAVVPAAPAQATVEVVRHQLNTGGARFAGKSEEEVSAIKIQTAFRVYLVCSAILVFLFSSVRLLLYLIIFSPEIQYDMVIDRS